MRDLLTHADLNDRRRALGMSCRALAGRSGVSLPTVQRVMGGEAERTAVANVRRIAEALGLDLAFTPIADAETYRQKQAEEKARELVRMVQGTSGLEAQAVDETAMRRMIDRTKQELLKSKLKLWAA